jgi:putative two-component system response regulator
MTVMVGSAASLSGHVLVVDDEEANLRLVGGMLTREGYTVSTASNGREALDVAARVHPDLILMDVMMPEQNGIEACRLLKRDPDTCLIPVIFVTAHMNLEDRKRGFDAGADDFVAKPFNAQELRARVQTLIQSKRYTDDLDFADSVIVSLAMEVEQRGRAPEGHCQRLAISAAALGRHVGVSAEDVSALQFGGFLHDLGNTVVPEAILLKPGLLRPAEHELLQPHTIVGDRLCGELRSLRRVRPIVRHHHERLDGSGYPDGLRGDAIPLVAQILSIADAFDAATTVRPYRGAVDAETAYTQLINEVDRGWRRRDLVEGFIQLGRAGRLSRPVASAPSVRPSAGSPADSRASALPAAVVLPSTAGSFSERQLVHEFNNKLSIILGFSELLAGDIEDGDPRRESVREIAKAARGAMDLVPQIDRSAPAGAV